MVIGVPEFIVEKDMVPLAWAFTPFLAARVQLTGRIHSWAARYKRANPLQSILR